MTGINTSSHTGDPLLDFDVAKVKVDFPILNQTVSGHPLVYLDNAASTQKPNQVIDCIADYYRHSNANIHRGVYDLSDDCPDTAANATVDVNGCAPYQLDSDDDDVNGDAGEYADFRHVIRLAFVICESKAIL